MRISRYCFAKLVVDFHTTFLPVSHECRENFHVSRTSRKLVAKVLNTFKNFKLIFSPKYFARLSCDSHTTFVRVLQTQLQEICESVAQHSYKFRLVLFSCQIVRRCLHVFSRLSYDIRTSVAKILHCKNFAL